MDTEKYVNQLMRTLSFIKDHSPTSRNDLVKVLVDTRQLLEISRTKNEFPLLNLFLNWCLHPRISESSIAYDLLHDLSARCLCAARKKSSETEDKEATRAFVAVAENALNIPSLRQEYIRLYRKFRLPKFLLTVKNNWDAFAKVILEEIHDKPLTFPEDVLGASSIDEVTTSAHKKAYTILQKIRALDPSRPWVQLVEVAIKKDSEGFKGLYCIQANSLGRVRYIVQLKGAEPKEAFNK